MKRKLYAFSILSLLLICTTTFVAHAENSSCTVSLEVEKAISGDTPSTEESFDFVLTAVGNEPMPAETSITIKGEGTQSFGDIVYTTVGDYRYTLSETKGDAVGYTYDNTVYDITVQVTTDDSGNLSAAVYMAKDGSDGKSAKAIFTNNYDAPDPVVTHTPGTNNEDPSNDSNKNVGYVDTGDNSNLSLWIGLSALGLIGLVVTLIASSKDRKSEK